MFTHRLAGKQEDDLVFLLDVAGVVGAHAGVAIAECADDLVVIGAGERLISAAKVTRRPRSVRPGPTVAAYLAAQAATSKASTLGRRVAAIRYAHKLAGLALPTDAEGVKATMRGIRRTFGSARIRKALRRSELVALDVADIEETETGLLVTIRAGKTDQEGQGVTIAIARGNAACPARALAAWLEASGIQAGAIFRPIDKGGMVRASRLTC